MRNWWNGVFAFMCFGLFPSSVLAIAADIRASLPLPKLQIMDLHREMTAPNKNEMLRTLRYPPDGRRAGAQGSVYLLLKVNPVIGVIDSVHLASAASDKTGFESKFSDAAVEVARKFVLIPMPELKPPHRIFMPFVFALGRWAVRVSVK